MTTARPIDPDAMPPGIHLVRSHEREAGEAIVNFMRDHLDQLVTRSQILGAVSWIPARNLGLAMYAGRIVADEQGMHLSFYLYKRRGYVLTAHDAEVAIEGVGPRVKIWANGAQNIGRTGRFINGNARDTIRRKLGHLLDVLTEQATSNMQQVAEIIDLHEKDLKKKAAKKTPAAKTPQHLKSIS